MRNPLAAVALLALLAAAGCTKVYAGDPHASASTLLAPLAPSPVAADVITFQVVGDVGGAPVLVKFSDSIDGLTVLPAVGLPYLATLRSTDDAVTLFLEASTTGYAVMPTVSGALPVLQVQIAVNGRAFRDGYSTGYGALVATASGTWRR